MYMNEKSNELMDKKKENATTAKTHTILFPRKFHIVNLDLDFCLIPHVQPSRRVCSFLVARLLLLDCSFGFQLHELYVSH